MDVQTNNEGFLSSCRNLLQKNTMFIALVLILTFFAMRTGGSILYPANINSLILQNAYVFILATGMLLCILTGGNIDLSVGSVVCFVGAVGAVLMEQHQVSIPLAIICMFLIGTFIGIFQAFWISFARIPSFIVTLAGMLAFRGLSNVILDGKTVSIGTQKSFISLFGGGANCYIPDIFHCSQFNLTCLLLGLLVAALVVFYRISIYRYKRKNGIEVSGCIRFALELLVQFAVIGGVFTELSFHKGIPTVLIWVLLVILFYMYLTGYTRIGKYLYAVGGNEEAARLSGIHTNKVYFFAFANMGFLSALAAMVTMARMTSAQATYGMNYEMDAIAACFIGGASTSGGVGKVSGVIAGALLMGIINLGMALMGVDQNMQKVVKGIVLLLAVIFDVMSKRKRGKLL